jgi:ketosteroid isomerase-like protein
MKESATAPADVVRAVTAAVSRLISGNLDRAEQDALLDELAGLYADQTDVRHPFAPLPTEPLRSPEDLRRHFAAALDLVAGVERFEPSGFVVYETDDPEQVIVEFSYVGIAGGRAFELPNIMVARVRDGQIVWSRDYAPHVAFARAFGRLGALADALGAESRGV